jgi:hypothetical protein
MIFIFSALLISSVASAQEYGFVVGVHQTNATSDVDNTSTDGVLNWNAGLAMAFELVPNLRFKTGAIYNERHVDVKVSVPKQTYGYNFTYIDVPANVQYNINEMVGVFGGLVVGINVGDDVKAPKGTTLGDPDVKSLIPLVDVGVNFMFADMIGFDVYYERGLGDAAKDFGKYNTFGGNFIYWF